MPLGWIGVKVRPCGRRLSGIGFGRLGWRRLVVPHAVPAHDFQQLVGRPLPLVRGIERHGQVESRLMVAWIGLDLLAECRNLAFVAGRLGELGARVREGTQTVPARDHVARRAGHCVERCTESNRRALEILGEDDLIPATAAR